ncbi:MAG: protein kinase [Actinomycetota bacterium]
MDLGIDGLSDYRTIGSGGFATVYAASEAGFDRTVAVKVLHSLDDDGVRRFERERRIMGRLASHPNIITPFKAGYTNTGAPYLVMEFIEGGSLEDEVRARGRLPWAQAVDHASAAASALSHAHGQGVLHRDVKPANILLAGGVAKLTDFGIAAIQDLPASQVAYTLAHAPPETFADGADRRDERADLYSLASTLYALLSGRAPYDVDGPDSQHAYMFRILESEPPELTGVPAPLAAFCAQALARDPARRPASGDEFVERLRAARTVASGDAAGSVTYTAPTGASATVSAPPAVSNATVAAPDAAVVPTLAPPPGRRNVRTIALGAAAVVVAAGGMGAAALALQGGDTPTTTTADVQAVAGSTPSEPSTTEPSEGATATTAPGSASAGSDTPAVATVDDAERVGSLVPAVFVAARDDGSVVSGNFIGQFEIWDPAELTVGQSLTTGQVGDLAPLDDGRLGLLLYDGRIRIVDPGDEKPEIELAGHQPLEDTPGQVGYAIDELPDGRIVTAGVDGVVLIWDPADPEGEPVRYTGHRDRLDLGVLTELTASVWEVVVLSDGRIASGTLGGEVAIWDPGSPEETPFMRDGNGVLSIDELPDGRLVIGDTESGVRVWDPVTDEVVRFERHTDWVYDVQALPDGRVATIDSTGLLLLWDPDQPDAVVEFTGHLDDDPEREGVRAWSLTRLDDGRLAVAGERGVLVWEPPPAS